MSKPVTPVQQTALRPGDPKDWGATEYSWQITARICTTLATSRVTDEIREAVTAELARQNELLAK